MDELNRKEWTVMFYFASDNPLAPGVISQLKAIKQAGFHSEANVITQFDPQTVGTPTHIFEVNLVNKLKSHGAQNIGFRGDDPFVRNLLEDKLWRDQTNRREKLLRDELAEVLKLRFPDIDYNPPVPPDDRGAPVPPRVGRSRELPPRQSLENFLRFCVDKYPARHYMLLILGHGVVVGNDIFLFDEHVSDRTNTLSLVELGEVLATFAREVRHQKSEFELLGLHSCSVSSLEVAYELKGTAKFMLASQGPAFVGSWPYRQILIRLFNELVECGGDLDVKQLLRKIFYYSLYNSADFLLAGYSFDLCLCNLDNVSEIECSLRDLTKVLVEEGLKNCLITNLILLAHWRSQSFWQESYTDLYDFCFCLDRLCGEYVCVHQQPEQLQLLLKKIQRACRKVKNKLKPSISKNTKPNDKDRAIIYRSAFVGPAYQYSHGLSVYFPWTRPVEDSEILQEYKTYKFTSTCWLMFLKEYFRKTLREPRKDEDTFEKRLEDVLCIDPNGDHCSLYKVDCKPEDVDYVDDCKPQEDYSEMGQTHKNAEEKKESQNLTDRFRELLEDIASLVYNDEGQLSETSALEGPKTDPRDPTGDACSCGSIKNYPRDTRARLKKGSQAPEAAESLPLSETFLKKLL